MEVFGNYGYVALFLVAGFAFVGFSFALSALLRPAHPTASKLIPYECGEVPRGEAWVQYHVRYYLFAMLFVLFDVEAAFLIPWAVGFREMFPLLGAVAILDMALFVGLLLGGLLYAWKKEALRWV